MKTFAMTSMAVILAVLCLPTTAFSALADYEPFDYTTGQSLDAQTDWSDNGNKYWEIQSGLSYPDLAVTGGSAGFNTTIVPDDRSTATNNPIPAAVGTLFNTDGSTIYITALFTYQGALILADGSDFIQLSMEFDKAANPTGDAFIKLSNNGGGESSDFVAKFDNLGATNMIAVKIDMAAGNDTLKAVVNPDLSLGEPNWAAAPGSITGVDFTHDITQYRLSWDGRSAISERGNWDEIRIGGSWADVTPADIPEPSTLAMTLLALGGLFVRGRRGC